MSAAPVEGTSSVIVRNVAQSSNPPTHKVLADFFTFCGSIVALSVAADDKDPSGQSVMAIVTFESHSAARTAVLLDNALINERSIRVELAPPGFFLTSDASNPNVSVHAVPSSEIPQNADGSDQSSTQAIIELLAKGYTLQKDALNSAAQFDEQHAISKRASELAGQAAQGIRNVDAQLGVSATLKVWGDSLQSKAVELGQTYQVNEKTQVASQLLGNFGRSVGGSLEGAAQSTGAYVHQSPSYQTANEIFSAWGAALAGVFRDAKALSDAQEPVIAIAQVPQDGGVSQHSPQVAPVAANPLNPELAKQ